MTSSASKYCRSQGVASLLSWKWAFATILSTVGLAASSQPAFAQGVQSIEEVPTNWRMQVYVGVGFVIWNTPASCSGRLEATHLSQAEQDKLWSLILSAKLSSHRVGIEYDVQGSNCFIRSYYIQQP